MQTSTQRLARLAVALDDLVVQEAAAVAANDFAVVAELQERAAPLIDFLVASATDTHEGDLRTRIAHIKARRAVTAQCLTRQLARTQDELRELKANQRRLARVAPVYATGLARERRLAAVG